MSAKKLALIYPRGTGRSNVSIENITGFKNYTKEIIDELRNMFIDEKIDSRPLKYNDVVMWLDVEQRLHRIGYPAIEKESGNCEYWENGVSKKHNNN